MVNRKRLKRCEKCDGDGWYPNPTPTDKNYVIKILCSCFVGANYYYLVTGKILNRKRKKDEK